MCRWSKVVGRAEGNPSVRGWWAVGKEGSVRPARSDAVPWVYSWFSRYIFSCGSWVYLCVVVVARPSAFEGQVRPRSAAQRGVSGGREVRVRSKWSPVIRHSG